MLFNQAVIEPGRILVIGGKWSIETHQNTSFSFLRETTFRKHRRPLPQYFVFSKRRFPFKRNQDGSEHRKLVSYANV
jgi:hypothetical protein